MINSTTLDKLEYHFVLEMISNYSTTQSAKNTILNLKPFLNVNDAITEGKFVTEAKEILIYYDYPPLNYLPDLSNDLAQSRINGTILRIESIRKILELAEISRKLFTFLKRNSNSEIGLFNNLAINLFVDKNFETHISKVFTPNGEIKDNASRKLNEIRKEIIVKSSNLKKVISNLLKGFSNSYLVQEEYVTQRDGRLVLPIKAEHKRHIKGFIHSESNTGQTVYIEPEETLELNNEILSLSFAEKREIEKILAGLTELIGTNSIQLQQSFSAITHLDIIFAKAKYSLEIIGAFPNFSRNKSISIIEGRHPILLKKYGRDNCIPLNFKYEDNNVTLITGPNAGGKTVVLKTIGLLSLLAQSGIHIPVSPDSEFYYFDKIMLDIGDEQSIEDDLSTFSSHLKNMREIVDEADEKSLVLIDEIGTGTDPSEGTALAASFLIHLNDKKSITIATTHHGKLKIIASELDGFQNASMEFDLTNLQATYVFRQGIPGSSYAFEVAEKIGLDKSIITLAREYTDSEKVKIENFIIDLENKSLQLKQKLDQLEIENTRLKGLSNIYERENKKLKEQKNKIIKNAKEQADTFLKNINSQFEKTIKNIKESNAQKNVIKEEREKIKSIKGAVEKKFIVEEKIIKSDRELRVGDFVKIKDSLTEGEIVNIDKEKRTSTIDTGKLRIKVKLDSLVRIKSLEANSPQPSSFINSEIESTTLDIRGRKPEEVEYEIVKFIDDAHLSGLKQLEIIHGKGTGVLRETVHTLLKNHKFVKSYQLAGIELGGSGVTIVLIK